MFCGRCFPVVFPVAPFTVKGFKRFWAIGKTGKQADLDEKYKRKKNGTSKGCVFPRLLVPLKKRTDEGKETQR